MIIKLHSYVNPIQSITKHDKEVVLKKETVQAKSLILPIKTVILVSQKSETNIRSYISPIVTDTIVKNIAKNETINLNSFIKHIQVHTDASTPSNANVFNAYLSYQENDSEALFIENRTFTEVIN
ncbi:hypothetical protein [Bacillus norwichensis]|uniref:Uncharacterized protein n=1 Tax=Bacillus norwichensis TaxID=2762217 RepID=A0ABR8VNE0_9BACI|nr:hypothetical protein [Bacillus norwichensis]MBD8006264.1 hypothetical protein [Bacillus norwichensis]